MRQSRRPFGGIERRGTVYRARYHGPDGCRYEAPHLFVARIDAEHWLAEVHRDIASDVWRPPQKEAGTGSEMAFLTGFARHCLAVRDRTPRTREEYTKLLEGLILPSLGDLKLRYLEPDHVRRWYSTVLNDDGPPSASTRTHSCAPSSVKQRKRA